MAEVDFNEEDTVTSVVRELQSQLAADSLARVTPRLRAWQDELERGWSQLPERLAVAPRGRGTGWLMDRWLSEREAQVRATAASTDEDRALARLQLATLEGLRSRLQATTENAEPARATESSPKRTASDSEPTPTELARYVLTLEGREAPLGNLTAILELWAQVVARGARSDAGLARFAEPRLRLGPGAGEVSVVFEATEELIAELRPLLARVGARDA